MRKGFTLLELIIVIIIIGILATLGFTQYAKMVEKGRSSEARMILGTIRTAEEAYKLESATSSYATAMSELPIDAPTTCDSTHYFKYAITDSGATATASRCAVGSGGKAPAATYDIKIDFANASFSGL